MEDHIQTIIIALISTFLLFIFPVYMAYEKKDDISYALAVRYTQTLVDEVRSKGYLTYDMYAEYATKLRATGNSFNIDMTHTYNRYDPITNYYKLEDGKYVLTKSTTQEEREAYIASLLDEKKIASKDDMPTYDKTTGFDKVENTYKLETEVYGTNYILNILKKENKEIMQKDGITVNAYTMNVDDNFNITIKNTNVTLATLIYNMVTIGKADVNTRLYVNYGGTILRSKWFDNKDYTTASNYFDINAKNNLEIFPEERTFTDDSNPFKDIDKTFLDFAGNSFAIEFFAYPEKTTELRDKGILRDYTGYNFAVGNNNSDILNGKAAMSVSVGINGVSIVSEGRALESGSGSIYTFEQQTRYYKEPITEINIYGEEIIVGERDVPYTYQTSVTDYDNIRLKIEDQELGVYLNGDRKGSISLDAKLATWLNDLGYDKTYGSKAQTVNIDLGNVPNTKSSFYAILSISNTSISISAAKDTYAAYTLLSYPMKINDYAKIRVEVKNNIPVLYIDGEKVAEGISVGQLYINTVGRSNLFNTNYKYIGKLKNVIMYNLEEGE